MLSPGLQLRNYTMQCSAHRLVKQPLHECSRPQSAHMQALINRMANVSSFGHFGVEHSTPRLQLMTRARLRCANRW